MFPKIFKQGLKILQVNIGYKCNQTCTHCHVNAGPHRLEMMDTQYIDLIPKIISKYNLKVLDITGGAPEMHKDFKRLISMAKNLNVEVIDRCNLTILTEPGYEDMAEFLASKKVTIIASLPCYEIDNVDMQRGKGVFNKSIEALSTLNKLGYGSNEDLQLNLIYNPIGPTLPPPQAELEKKYKSELLKKYGIEFNNLYTLANVPIKRFANQLSNAGELDKYNVLLRKAHNRQNLDSVMCRNLISIDWQGNLYDCDFNQQLGLKLSGEVNHMNDLIDLNLDPTGMAIKVDSHCYACTAGSGSSCTGALSDK